NGNLDVILGDLERLTESLSNVLTGFSLRRGEFTSAVLHHVENVINTDFAISGHLLNDIARGAELRRQRINDRITRLGNHRQRVIHDHAAVVDSLKEPVHGAVKFCCASTGTDNRPTNLIENLYRVVTLNPGVRKRLGRLAVRRIINRGRRRKFLNPLKRLKRLIAILIQTTNSGLDLLLINTRPAATSQRRTTGGTSSGNTNNSTRLQRPTSSGGHTGTHRPARAVPNLRDSLVY